MIYRSVIWLGLHLGVRVGVVFELMAVLLAVSLRDGVQRLQPFLVHPKIDVPAEGVSLQALSQVTGRQTRLRERALRRGRGSLRGKGCAIASLSR